MAVESVIKSHAGRWLKQAMDAGWLNSPGGACPMVNSAMPTADVNGGHGETRLCPPCDPLPDRPFRRFKQRQLEAKTVYRRQSCPSLSSAWARPFIEKVSIVSVPLADMPLTTRSGDL